MARHMYYNLNLVDIQKKEKQAMNLYARTYDL